METPSTRRWYLSNLPLQKSMNHTQYTLYVCIIMVYFWGTKIDAISLITLYIFLGIFQYLYWLCLLDTRTSASFELQKCMKCNSMTPQHYIHCDRCKKCQSVDKEHFNILDTCVRKSAYKRYILFLRAFIVLLCILTILQSILHTLVSIVFIFVHVYVLKSTYDTDSRNIYVT